MSDSTLENAGDVGRDLAETLAEKIIVAIEGFPARDDTQRPAILRVIARTLDAHADEMEESP